MVNIKKVVFTKEIVIENKWMSYLPESYGAFLCDDGGLYVVRVINTIGELIRVIPIHMIESYTYASRSSSEEPVFSGKKSRRSRRSRRDNQQD